MAESGERRMLFDTRGRRRNVIRVVYAVLALLMGGSLFLTVGPFNISEILGTGGSSGNAAEIFDERAEAIEQQLAKKPKDEALLLALTRARVNAGNAQAEIDPQTGRPGSFPAEAQQDFDTALLTWNRYLNQTGEEEANSSVAQLVASAYFILAERGSTSLGDIEENLNASVRAQRIVAAARPSAGSLSSLAIYEYFNGNFGAGDAAAKRATGLARAKPERKESKRVLAQYRKRARAYRTSLNRVQRAQQRAGGEPLQNPLGGGFGGGAPGG